MVAHKTRDALRGNDVQRTVLVATPDQALASRLEHALDGCSAPRYQVSTPLRGEWLNLEKRDALLLDLRSREATIECLRAHAEKTAVVLLCDEGDEERTLSGLEAGAQEYVHLSDITASSLRRAIEYAITHRRAQSLRKRLEHSNRLASLGQLTAGVAHELSNPATYSLINLLQMEDLLAKLAAGQRVDGAIDLLTDLAVDCRRGIELIASISRELKHFARVDEPSGELVDLSELIANTCTMVQSQIQHRARLEQRVEKMPPLACHRSKLSQVLVNLLVNAAQAIDGGRRDENEIRIEGLERDGWIEIRVSDTGSGIPADKLESIFEPYYTTKPKGVGTGLGLPISAEIVGIHKGTLSVESIMGQGTTFVIRLPRENGIKVPSPPSVREEKTVKPGENSRKRVLIVDDEPLLLRSLARMLQSHHEVVTASGGEKALAILAEDSRFDAIVCDLMMPGVDGLQVHETVHADHPELEARLVFLSGGVFTQRMEEFLRRTEPILLDKPVARDVLLEALRNLSGGSPLHSS